MKELSINKKENFYKLVLKIAVPIILQNFLQNFVNMLDTVMIGQLGAVDIAAVGLGNQIFFMLNMILFGISSGGSIFVAQYWGKKDLDGIYRTMGIVLSLSILASSIMAFLAIVFPEVLMRMYTNDRSVVEVGTVYLRTVGWSYIIIAVSFVLQMVYRTTEHVILPTVSTAVAFSMNAILNFILIFGFKLTVGSFEIIIRPFGSQGAAIATVVSRAVELTICVTVGVKRKFECLTNVRKYYSFTKSHLGKFFKIALPVIFNESIWGLGISTQNAIYSRSGTDVIAAFNITNTVNQLTWVFLIGLGSSCSIILGKKIGEGDYELTRKYALKFAILVPLFGLIIAPVLIPVSFGLKYFFNVEQNILDLARKMIYVLIVFYPFNSFNMCYVVGICRSGGDTLYAAFNDIFWMWAVAIPLGFFAAFVLKVPGWAIYLTLCIEQIIKAIAGILRIKSGKWLKALV